MFENPPGETQVFDFEEVANHLLEQGLQTSPSELHGCLCGLLAGGENATAEAGLAGVLQATGLDLHGELAALVMQLYSVSNAALRDEEFDFHPLLPPDEADIEERADALAGWCRGFLAGFAQVSSAPAGQDTSEILKDFANIATAGVDEDEDEEESESNLAEITEYLRIAALNVFLDSLVEEDDGTSTTGGTH
jgi:hypothetical protein